MATLDQQLRDLNEQRQRAWHEAKEILDRPLIARRSLTAEEAQSYERANTEISRLEAEIKRIEHSDENRAEVDGLNAEVARVTAPARWDESSSIAAEANAIRELIRSRSSTRTIDYGVGGSGPVRASRGNAPIEMRVLTGDNASASGGSLTLPTDVSPLVWQRLTAQSALMRMNCTVVDTQGGNPYVVPTVTAGAATQIANENTSYGGTDESFTAITLDAFDAGKITSISNDLQEDSDIGILDWVGQNIGRAVGVLAGQWLATGTGSGQPRGVMNSSATGAAGTIASGGSLLIGPAGREVEKLIDLQFSVADSYRQRGASWLMRDSTGAVVRKLRDGAGGTAGQFIWQPSATVGMSGGQPDTFLGDPVFFDVNVASMASDARVICYGDFSSFYVRRVAPAFRLAVSSDLYFDKNMLAMRGLMRLDSGLADVNALNYLHMAVT